MQTRSGRHTSGNYEKGCLDGKLIQTHVFQLPMQALNVANQLVNADAKLLLSAPGRDGHAALEASCNADIGPCRQLKVPAPKGW